MPAPAPLSEPATANTFGTAPEPSDRAPAIELLSAARYCALAPPARKPRVFAPPRYLGTLATKQVSDFLGTEAILCTP